MDKGELPDAEVTLTVALRRRQEAIVDQDAGAAMQAFMSGKVKVQGDMMKLMSLQGMGPTRRRRRSPTRSRR